MLLVYNKVNLTKTLYTANLVYYTSNVDENLLINDLTV